MLPKIDPGILGSVKHEINESWGVKTFERVKKHDPVMGELMSDIWQKLGPNAVVKALLVYRLIESQVEANELKEMFDD